jgi:hypothetical protein
MIRRLTALLAMAVLLGLLALLIVEVRRHHRRGFSPRPEATVVVNFSLAPVLAA